MATSAATTWRITGEYFENCNCQVVCPCLFSANPPFGSQPTEGPCEVAFGFHIDQGSYGDVALDGLNVALFARSPGVMADGNWSLAAYLDERAEEGQSAALQAIFTGANGGPMATLAPLISQVLGITPATIIFSKDGTHRSLEIPDIAHLEVHALPSGVAGEAIWASNIHPFNPEGVAMAIGDTGSVWEGYGMRWDNSGRNGHYAPIKWSNA